MLTHSASGAVISEAEWQQIWEQRQKEDAIARITGRPYRDPLERD